MNSEKTQTNKIDTSEFLTKLSQARENHDIYVTARVLGVLMNAGITVSPTEEEKKLMVAELDKVRGGEVDDFFKNVEGYMVARWIMLVQHFLPGTVEVTEQDKEMINKAATQYIQDEEYHQIASLIQTCEMIDVELDLSKLIEDGINQVREFRKTME